MSTENKLSHLSDIESTKGEIDLPTESDPLPTLPVNTLQEEKEDQEDIWMGAIKIIEDGEFQRTKYKEVLEHLKSKYHITRIKQ